MTGGLTGFKLAFIPGTYHDTPSTKTNTTTGEASIIGQGTASYSFLDDNGEIYTLKTLMSYAPMSKYCLISPQWIGLQEKSASKPKDLRSTCQINDEDATIMLEDRTITVTIKHDPTMLVPVLNVNPGIRNYQDFSASFCSIIQDQHDNNKSHLTLDYEELQSNESIALFGLYIDIKQSRIL